MTTRGRCLLAGGLAAAVCALLLDERDLLRVGILAVVLPLAAWVLMAFRHPRIDARHQVLPDRLTPGSVGQVTLTITNVGVGSTRALELTEAPSEDLTSGVRCLLPGLRRDCSARATYRLYAGRRGRFRVGPPQIRVSDPFGLWEDVSTLDAITEVLVVPTAIRLTGLPAGAGNRSAASGRAAQGSVGGDPDIAIRTYRNGDDIRTVHWRASARHDELMVRLEEPVSHGGAVVLVDHRAGAHRGAGAGSSLETAVTLAASVSLHLLATDHEVLLAGQSGVVAHGHDISDDVLAGLAVLEPAQDAPLLLPSIGTAGMVIAVLGEVTPSSVSAMVASRPRGVQAVALMLDVADWAAEGDPAVTPTVPARSALEAAGWRTVIVGRSDDLAVAWRQACRSGEDFGSRQAVAAPAASAMPAYPMPAYPVPAHPMPAHPMPSSRGAAR